MIQSLYIRNYALIDELEVSFGPGLNIITGETGAGKSIILGALNAVLGERADTETVRQGANKAVVEAVILAGPAKDPVLEALLREHDTEFSGRELILRREIRSSGSRAFINDSPVSISLLRSVGDRLVDLHGQHDHQLLLRQEHHREVVDGLEPVRPYRHEYDRALQTARKRAGALEQLKKQEREWNEKRELNRFQLSELRALELDEESYAEMLAEMKRLDYAEELDQKAGLIAHLGSGAEGSLMDLMVRIEHTLREMSDMDSAFGTYHEEMVSSRVSMQELISYAERYRASISADPERLETLRHQQAELRRLEKKYSRSLPGLLAYREELEQALSVVENLDLELEKREKALAEAVEELKNTAVALQNARMEASNDLGNRISTVLQRLGIPHNRFETRVSWREDPGGWFEVDGVRVGCQSDGPGEVAFFISTNKGEQPRPLARIASGGEVSRVMLAMKSVIAAEQHLPVMIFDEIDTGIAGAVAEKVGETMHELAQMCQIIAITHQAQIAGQADGHYRVQKNESADRMVTEIKKLDEQQRVEEVASLMSGSQVSSHALATAQEMIARAQARYG